MPNSNYVKLEELYEFYTLGIKFLNNNKLYLAKYYFSKSISDYCLIYVFKGLIDSKRGKFDQAIKYFQNAEKLIHSGFNDIKYLIEYLILLCRLQNESITYNNFKEITESIYSINRYYSNTLEIFNLAAILVSKYDQFNIDYMKSEIIETFNDFVINYKTECKKTIFNLVKVSLNKNFKNLIDNKIIDNKEISSSDILNYYDKLNYYLKKKNQIETFENLDKFLNFVDDRYLKYFFIGKAYMSFGYYNAANEFLCEALNADNNTKIIASYFKDNYNNGYIASNTISNESINCLLNSRISQVISDFDKKQKSNWVDKLFKNKPEIDEKILVRQLQ